MACKNCTETTYLASAYYSAYQNCREPLNSCSTSCKEVVDSACVVYTGPAFVNIPLDSNVCTETILSTIDGMLSAITGNYSSYNTGCLGTQNTQQQFVETISSYVCDTRTSLNNVINNTLPTGLNNLQTQVTGILNPGMVSCSAIGIGNTDTYTQVLNKIIGNECSIISSLDLSGANWNSCFTITGTPPTTPLQAVNALIGQICSIKNSGTGVTLPLFNNTNTCISGGGTTDTLVNTVIAIRDLVCSKPTLNINALTFGCVTKPSSVATDLQGTLQSMLSNLTALNNKQTIFNPAHFTTTLVDSADACKGYTISLASTVTPVDRLVAANNADSTPGTLVAKIIGAGGITTSVISNQLVIDGSGIVPAASNTVKSSVSDPTAGYLGAKLTAAGDGNGLELTTSINGSNQVVVNGTIDMNTLVTRILEELNSDSDLKTILCTLVASCPISCAPPTNVTVTTA